MWKWELIFLKVVCVVKLGVSKVWEAIVNKDDNKSEAQDLYPEKN